MTSWAEVTGRAEAGPRFACFVEGAVKAEMWLLPELRPEAVRDKHLAPLLLPLSCQGLHVRNPAGSQQQGELTDKSSGASGQRQRAEQSRGGEGLSPWTNHPGPAHMPFLHGNHLWSSLTPSTPPTLFPPASIMYEHIDIFFTAVWIFHLVLLL